jgi:redox-sensitive bicupin YhaK (pirin superfamily)
VATDAVHARDLALLRPLRAPWLEGALGPAPEAAWLQHAPSGVTLRIDAPIVRALSLAARSDGPITVPESVSRFLARVAGAIEGGASRRFGEDHFTVLDRPRGRLVASGTVRQLINAGAEYAGD